MASMPQPMNFQRGFGLGFRSSVFETIGMPLIIVAVLAWVAWGAFADHQAKTRVAEGLALAASAQAAVDQAVARRGPGGPPGALDLKWKPPAANENLLSIVVAASGVITIRFTPRVAAAGENQIQIVPVVQGRAIDLGAASNAGSKYAWQCGGSAGNTTVPENRRPETCR